MAAGLGGALLLLALLELKLGGTESSPWDLVPRKTVPYGGEWGRVRGCGHGRGWVGLATWAWPLLNKSANGWVSWGLGSITPSAAPGPPPAQLQCPGGLGSPQA